MKRGEGRSCSFQMRSERKVKREREMHRERERERARRWVVEGDAGRADRVA